jgi:acetyl esterase
LEGRRTAGVKESGMTADSSGHRASPFEERIRAVGAVLDMPLTQQLYKPLLEKQPREGVVVHRDLSYGSDERHRLDLYLPQHFSGTLPCILFLHGGGFIRGDKAERENIGQFFARRQFAVAVANYRLAPNHMWPAGAEDVISAYRWIRSQATSLRLDSEALYLAGESAGAAHVAAAVLAKRFHPSEGLKIAGAMLISGVYNAELERLATQEFGIATPDPRNEPYFGSDFARYRSMSTVRLVDAAPTPLLITFAELDPVQMVVQAGELFARLVADHGYKPRMRVIRGHNHLTQLYAINTGDETLTTPMLEFLGSRGT